MKPDIQALPAMQQVTDWLEKLGLGNTRSALPRTILACRSCPTSRINTLKKSGCSWVIGSNCYGR
jgi:hypothetical protein